MRYKCRCCKKYVKDKFIFGLMHICNDDEYYHEQQTLKLKKIASEVFCSKGPLEMSKADLDQLKAKILNENNK